MTDPLDRIRQLIAKAVDPAVSEEEGRTLAKIAVQSIHREKWFETFLDEIREYKQTITRQQTELAALRVEVMHLRRRSLNDAPAAFDNLLSRLERMRQHVQTDLSGDPAPSPRPPPGSGPWAYRRPPPVPVTTKPWQERLPCALYATVPYVCVCCGETIHPVTRVWAIRFKGRLNTELAVCHFSCREDLLHHPNYGELAHGVCETCHTSVPHSQEVIDTVGHVYHRACVVRTGGRVG